MQANCGTIDRVGRVILAAVLGALALAGVVTGPLAIGLGVFAVVLVGTAAVGVCPLYLPFKLSTVAKKA
jgi:hypothetical protein